jgi:hypothetical protein
MPRLGRLVTELGPPAIVLCVALMTATRIDRDRQVCLMSSPWACLQSCVGFPADSWSTDADHRNCQVSIEPAEGLVRPQPSTATSRAPETGATTRHSVTGPKIARAG